MSRALPTLLTLKNGMQLPRLGQLGVVCSGMRATALFAFQGALNHQPANPYQVPQLIRRTGFVLGGKPAPYTQDPCGPKKVIPVAHQPYVPPHEVLQILKGKW